MGQLLEFIQGPVQVFDVADKHGSDYRLQVKKACLGSNGNLIVVFAGSAAKKGPRKLARVSLTRKVARFIPHNQDQPHYLLNWHNR